MSKDKPAELTPEQVADPRRHPDAVWLDANGNKRCAVGASEEQLAAWTRQ